MQRYGIGLVLLLGLVLRLPGWFTADEKARFQLFEPDEIQHVDIALSRFQELKGDSLPHFFTPIFNVRGFGITAAHLAYAHHRLGGPLPDIAYMVMLNRQLATFFSLLLLLLLYHFSRRLGLPKPYALLAALLLACCDLNCTYSHYGIPEMGYVFGLYLSLFGMLLLQQQQKGGLWWMALGAALAFAFKFDFLPALVGASFLLFLATFPLEKAATLTHLLVFLLLLALFFGLLTGFAWPLADIIHAWQTLRAENENVVALDQHWRDNPLVYTAAIVAGIGWPVCWMALRGIGRISWPSYKLQPAIWAIALLFSLEIFVRWRIDTPFVRRAVEFMPAVCLLAAYGMSRSPWGVKRKLAIVLYTLLLALVGQSNHWWDTRSAAKEYVLNQLPATAKIVATPYVAVKGLPSYPRFDPARDDWDFAILHETYYQRYTLSLTTPFGYPVCCEGVYHCHSEAECEALQALVAGKNQTAELLASFPTRSILPERWLYKKIFGTYETFLGDVLIFRRTNED